MYQSMSKIKRILFVITCWLTTFTIMWQVPESVIVNSLFEEFPSDGALITAMLSWPSILTALSSIAAGALLSKISTKAELIISGITMLFMIAAPMPGNMPWLLICSLIASVGAGFSNTAGMALLNEVFTDEDLLSRHIGFYNAAMGLIGAAVSFAAGLAAVNGWKAAFCVDWIAVPMLLMTILFLPSVKPGERTEEKMQSEEGAGETVPEKKGFGARFWIFFVSMFIFFMAYVPFAMYISVYVSENALGGSAFAGTCITLGTLGSFVFCLMFGWIYGKAGRRMSCVILLADILLLLLAMLVPGKTAAILVCVFMGASYGGLFSLLYALGGEMVPPSQTGMAMGLLTFNYAVAMTVGVYIFQFLMEWKGSLTKALSGAVIMCGISLAIEIVENLRAGKKDK